MNNCESRSLEETAKFAAEWLAMASQNRENADGALVVGLSGHLGAGKTAFVKLVARELGVEETVTSPTFVIMKIYETKNPPFKRLVHVDAYRLERREELEALRFEYVVADPGNLVMIEWPENVGLEVGAAGLDSRLKFEIRDGVYLIADK